MALMELVGGNLQLGEAKMLSYSEERKVVVDTPIVETKPVKQAVFRFTGLNGMSVAMYANITVEKKDSRYNMDEYRCNSTTHSLGKGDLDLFDDDEHMLKEDLLAETVSRMKMDPEFVHDLLSNVPAKVMVKVMLSNGVNFGDLLPSPVSDRPSPFK